MSELLWISVPGGVDGRPLLRVLVVPRLDGGTLAGSGMAAWPSRGLLAGPALSVEWRAGEGSPITAIPVSSGDVTFTHQQDLWAQFFAAETPVGTTAGPVPPPEQPVVQPSSRDAQAISDTFAAPAAVDFGAPDSAPPTTYHAKVQEALATWTPDGADTPAPDPAPPGPPPPPPDFHLTISLLREHPAVLRALGLIFSVRVAPPAGLAQAGQVRIVWPAPDPGLPTIVSPWSMYGTGFLPASRGPEISRGMVTLTPDPAVTGDPGGRWTVTTVDVEGGARKLRDASQLVAAGQAAELAADPAKPLSLPTMRTAGIQLVRVDRHAEFERRRGMALESNARATLDGMVLDAEHLVLGYRIDIRLGNRWRSLHRRIATYHRGTPAQVIGEAGLHEEGHIKANGAARGADDVLRASEVVARWNGWSLATVRPRFDMPAVVPGPSRGAGLAIAFGWDFVAEPESLPRLRFTERYALRARVADIAGGGLTLDDPQADRCAITEIGYGRFEPVPSPPVLLEPGLTAADLGPGEAVDQVVVRSDPGSTVDAFVAQNPGYTMRPRRKLLRPRTSLAIAEQHKMLDHDDADQTFAWVLRAVAAGDAFGAEEAGDGPLPDPAAGGINAVPRDEAGKPPAATSAHRDWDAPWPQPEPPKTLELAGPQAGEPPVAWRDETLVVRLAPGERVTVELSSRLTADFLDHFALQDAMPASSKGAAQAGRHPLITPVHPVTLVHAVRKPIDPPDPGSTLTPAPRESGQTFAVLASAPTLFGVDVNSTGQLDVSAAWTEHADDATRQATASVQSFIVDRGDTVLKEPLRHEFGDTRHRVVTYTVTAVSRFRPFFHPSELTADPDAFVQRTQLRATVPIPNTARPAAPTVLGTRPAFTWKDSREPSAGGTVTLRRERLAGRLRVELGRPWFATGEGERLGVVLWDRPTGAAEPQAPLVTECGRDPIWDTTDPPRWPAESQLVGAAGPAGRHTLQEAAVPALVVPFEPFFHGDRWYADVALPGLASASYCPFVRLAVARCQPDSIADHHLSPVVLCAMTQLLPDRTLTVEQAGSTVQVSLAGLGPRGPQPNRVDVVVEQCGAPRPLADTVQMSSLEPGPTGDGVPVWRPVADHVVHTTLNAAPITVPLPGGGAATRLRIREVELVGADVGAPEPQAGSPGELGERVTFTDTVLLPLN
ncbi:hypothetical protein [Capillimicrobium parvum]|uniref:Uncharacterized protein n=1 Tax=Capillimicrobium parvum TaxID=2884022 RepID=A0A9E6XZ45_9ACTN|nr:hypothetical protein [Capillimicrobium parvum]UGS37149.1 hypothetical protein DSM104329_03564 [Capillimicrobium parvum]